MVFCPSLAIRRCFARLTSIHRLGLGVIGWVSGVVVFREMSWVFGVSVVGGTISGVGVFSGSKAGVCSCATTSAAVLAAFEPAVAAVDK